MQSFLAGDEEPLFPASKKRKPFPRSSNHPHVQQLCGILDARTTGSCSTFALDRWLENSDFASFGGVELSRILTAFAAHTGRAPSVAFYDEWSRAFLRVFGDAGRVVAESGHVEGRRRTERTREGHCSKSGTVDTRALSTILVAWNRLGLLVGDSTRTSLSDIQHKNEEAWIAAASSAIGDFDEQALAQSLYCFSQAFSKKMNSATAKMEHQLQGTVRAFLHSVLIPAFPRNFPQFRPQGLATSIYGLSCFADYEFPPAGRTTTQNDKEDLLVATAPRRSLQRDEDDGEDLCVLWHSVCEFVGAFDCAATSSLGGKNRNHAATTSSVDHGNQRSDHDSWKKWNPQDLTITFSAYVSLAMIATDTLYAKDYGSSVDQHLLPRRSPLAPSDDFLLAWTQQATVTLEKKQFSPRQLATVLYTVGLVSVREELGNQKRSVSKHLSRFFQKRESFVTLLLRNTVAAFSQMNPQSLVNSLQGAAALGRTRVSGLSGVDDDFHWLWQRAATSQLRSFTDQGLGVSVLSLARLLSESENHQHVPSSHPSIQTQRMERENGSSPPLYYNLDPKFLDAWLIAADRKKFSPRALANSLHGFATLLGSPSSPLPTSPVVDHLQILSLPSLRPQAMVRISCGVAAAMYERRFARSCGVGFSRRTPAGATAMKTWSTISPFWFWRTFDRSVLEQARFSASQKIVAIYACVILMSESSPRSELPDDHSWVSTAALLYRWLHVDSSPHWICDCAPSELVSLMHGIGKLASRCPQFFSKFNPVFVPIGGNKCANFVGGWSHAGSGSEQGRWDELDDERTGDGDDDADGKDVVVDPHVLLLDKCDVDNCHVSLHTGSAESSTLPVWMETWQSCFRSKMSSLSARELALSFYSYVGVNSLLREQPDDDLCRHWIGAYGERAFSKKGGGAGSTDLALMVYALATAGLHPNRSFLHKWGAAFAECASHASVTDLVNAAFGIASLTEICIMADFGYGSGEKT